MDEPMEKTLLMKQEANVYKLPANQAGGSEGWKATGWNLDKPDWQGKLRLVSKGKECHLRLEEKPSGKVYAQCPVDAYPGPSVQTVSDSSRYFVIRVSDSVHLGLGFADRSDSFDLNVALQDHFKSLKVEEELMREGDEPREKLDLSLKEGQTIKVNINIPRKSGRERSRSPGAALGPPPSAVSEQMAAAGIQVKEPKLAAPPVKQSNPNWIQF